MERTIPSTVYKVLPYLWLLLGTALLLFANGISSVPLAAWLGPVFLIRFLRGRKAWSGLLVGYLACAVVFYFQWSVAFKDAGAMFSLYTAAIGLLVFLPYVADRLLSPRIPGFLGTLVFPTAWVSLEYLLHLVLPLGTFFNLAYTQSSNLPLLQVMSVTGLWGVSFLVTWFASVAVHIWENGFDVRRVWKGPAVYALILAVVLLGGGLRLAVFRPTGPTVQVSVLTTDIDQEPLPDAETAAWQRLVDGTLSASEIADIQAKMDRINADLFDRARIQAEAGAKIVTFSEFNVQTFAGHEDGILATACSLAREEGIYLVFPLEITQPDLAKRSVPNLFQINESVMVVPDGSIAYVYEKHNLLIGPESAYTVRGPRLVRSVPSPYGTLASVICLDMEYPDFMRLAAAQGADIVLSGAIDGTVSSGGNPLHSIMASYRTIECGFSLARAGYYGQSVAVDYQGRVLGSINYYTAGERTLTARIPIHGVKTVYAALGDWFPIGALVAFALLALVPAARKWNHGRKERNERR